MGSGFVGAPSRTTKPRTDVPWARTYPYFSFACYTSLGIGDIVPVGGLRLLAGIEALNGLMLIGWSASFLLVEMRERWK